MEEVILACVSANGGYVVDEKTQGRILRRIWRRTWKKPWWMEAAVAGRGGVRGGCQVQASTPRRVARAVWNEDP
jgi:hypothetical protein